MNKKIFISLIVALVAILSLAFFPKEDTKMSAVTNSNFDNEVLQSDVPVLVDFWAEWCGPCRALGPTIDQIAEEYAGKAKIVKVNVQNEPALAEKYGIQSIPCLIIFKDGKAVNKLIGLQPKPNITAELDKAL